MQINESIKKQESRKVASKPSMFLRYGARENGKSPYHLLLTKIYVKKSQCISPVKAPTCAICEGNSNI